MPPAASPGGEMRWPPLIELLPAPLPRAGRGAAGEERGRWKGGRERSRRGSWRRTDVGRRATGPLHGNPAPSSLIQSALHSWRLCACQSTLLYTTIYFLTSYFALCLTGGCPIRLVRLCHWRHSFSMTKTWESVWTGLLTQAVALATCATTSGKVAASIVLSCTSWEAFANELIEWRRLHISKTGAFRQKLRQILNELGQPPDSMEQEPWLSLALLIRLRNELVHHKALPLAPGESPGAVLPALVTAGVIPSSALAHNWEEGVLVLATARWACERVASCMLTLEKLPSRRTRSLSHVQSEIRTAMKPLLTHRQHT